MQASNGLPGFENCPTRGVNVAVGPQSEWQIDYIQYDGTECFIPPPTFADVIAKNVAKIQWQDVIGNPSRLDADELDEEKEPDDVKSVEKDLLAFDAVREAAKDRIIPAAGPWTPVAKCLHESLQEVSVLLDTLRIAKNQHYLKVMQVAQPNEDNRSGDALNKAKSFLWVSHRKAFFEALNVLEVATKARQNSNVVERPIYFNELKTMRESWRIRKVNDFVFGDLGYRIYGPKFAQGEMFDIFWEPKPTSSTSSRNTPRKCIQVQIPKNLMRRTKLSVSLIKDNAENQEKILAESYAAQFQPAYYVENSRNISWEKALEWAQESLINKDIFARLMKEAVDERHVCIVAENSITVCLLNGMLLKFERKFYPFQDAEISQTGDPYLTNILHSFFVRDIVRPPYRPQQFVGLAVTTLPENLDLRGPQGVSAEELKSRVDKYVPLLTRVIEVANHYSLVDQVVDVLNQYMISRSDPQLVWRWVRSSPIFSMINCTLANRCYDSVGKITFSIKIGVDEIIVVTKDTMTVNCHRQMSRLHDLLNLQTANCQLLSASMLSKTYCWQTLHTNMNAVCKEGTPAPTFLACNQGNTKKLFIQFFTDGRPYQMHLKRVTMRQRSNTDETKKEGINTDGASTSQNLDEPMETDQGGTSDKDEFVPLNSARIPGNSLLRKLDHIYTMFSA